MECEDTGLSRIISFSDILVEDSDTISVSSFLQISENGCAVSSDSEKQGTFEIGASAVYTAQSEKDSDQVVTGSLTVFGSNSVIDEGITESFSSLDNKNLFMNSITAAIGDVNNLSIDAYGLTSPDYTVVLTDTDKLIKN